MTENAVRGTWAVVAQVSDPDILIESFVAHYRNIGATEVFLFFDHPNPGLQDRLGHMDGVTCFANSLQFFQNIHGRKGIPKKKTFRQALNATYASNLTQAEWILHCDVDEFLEVQGDISAELSTVERDIGYLEVRNLERRLVAGSKPEQVFEGVAIDPYLYAGRDDPMMRKGCLGHFAGKPMVRTGRGYHVAVHRAKIGKPVDRNFPPSSVLGSAHLIHFDGLTAFHWAVKLLRRASLGRELIEQMYNEHRLLQMYEVFSRARDVDDLERLYRSFDVTDMGVEWVKPIASNFVQAEGLDLPCQSFDASLQPYYKEALGYLDKMDINWRVLADDLRP